MTGMHACKDAIIPRLCKDAKTFVQWHEHTTKTDHLKRMTQPSDQSPCTLHLPSWPRLLLVGCVAASGGLTLLSGLAYRESAPLGFYGLFFWGGLAMATLCWLHFMPCIIGYQQGRLTVTYWWHTQAISVDGAGHVSYRRYQVTVMKGAQHLRCTFLSPNDSAFVMTWLEEQLPTLAASRLAAADRPLPLTITPRLVAPGITAGIVLLFGSTGGALLWTSWQAWQQGDGRFDHLGMGVFSFLLLFFAALFLYLLLDSYIWRFTFDEEMITLRHALHTERYSARQVSHVTLVTEERTVKGFVHQIYQLQLSLADGTDVMIAPNLPSFPMDYAGAEEARLLRNLQRVLEKHYVPVVRVDLTLDQVADSRWGRPVSAVQWQIRPYDLSVTRLDYGEHHAAASTVHILVGHSEAGAMRFRTTNGESRISPCGRYILLFDETLLIVFNLPNGRTYHRFSRQDWIYARVEFAEEVLIIEEMRRSDPQVRTQRKPISLQKPTSALRRGLGSAEHGVFPSAYG